MQKISTHIRKLLFDNSKVIINGLGYFEAIEDKAYHHPVGHDFTPKNKKISFRLDKNAKDSMLAESLGGSNANNEIHDFAQQVIKDLIAGKKVVLEGIGVIYKHEKGNVLFTQDEDVVFDKEFFGLEGFHQDPISKVAAVPVAAPVAIGVPVKDTSVKTQEKKVEEKVEEKKVEKVEEKVEEKKVEKIEEKEKGSMLWLWVAITGITASLIIAFVFLTDDTSDKVKETIVITSDKIIVEKDKVTEIKKIDTILIEENIADNEIAIVEKVEVIEEVVEVAVDKGGYYVMAGCFKSSRNATRYLKVLKEGDYPNAVIKGKTASGLIRVCYDKFASESVAESFMEKTSKKENIELWMQFIED